MRDYTIPANPYAPGVDHLIEAICATCDVRDLAMMFGATLKEAAEHSSRVLPGIVEEALKNRRQTPPPRAPHSYTPPPHRKVPYSGPVTPRLPENEWWPLRSFVLRRDGLVCIYCEETDTQFTADHVVPLSRGGSNNPDNLVACCIPCNSSKSDRLLSEWRGRYK